MLRAGAVVASVACVALLGLAGWSYFTEHRPPPPPGLEVDAVVELGDVVIHKPFPVVTRARNTSHWPARILNVGSGCGPRCCYRPLQEGPIEVPPGGKAEYRWEATIVGAGPFEAQVPMFLDDGGLRNVTILLRGNGVKGGSNEPD